MEEVGKKGRKEKTQNFLKSQARAQTDTRNLWTLHPARPALFYHHKSPAAHTCITHHDQFPGAGRETGIFSSKSRIAKSDLNFGRAAGPELYLCSNERNEKKEQE